MAEQWLSIVEFARTYDMSDMTVRRRIKNGKIKAVLRDGKYYIPVAPERNGSPQAPKSATNEMVVVKGATPATQSQNYFQQPKPQPQSSGATNAGYRQSNYATAPQGYGADDAVIPAQYKRSIEGSDTSVVHTQALINFCENTLRGYEKLDDVIHDKYKNKIMALESAVKSKDAEIASLCQQVEDLQLLVKVFEKKATR